jgi:glycosyltransferase involved in cell wall biosynthesis
MKVLFVCSGNSTVGINPIVESQGDSLLKSGINIEYFTVQGHGIYGYFKNIRKLKRHLRYNNYDIIHAHYGFCGIISQFARKSEKLIVSFMGEDILASYNFKGSFTFISKLYVKVNKFFAKKYFDYSIVKSCEMHKELGNLVNSSIIPNGVNTDEFKPIDKDEARKKLGISAEIKLLIFASNPDRPEKNYKLAVEAFNLLEIENTELRPVYNIPQREMVYYYNAADVLLLTSYHEGSPNVVKEAMACNCPIVSTDVGDVKEVISSTQGSFITSFDARQISDCLREVLFSSQKTNGRDLIEKDLKSCLIARKINSLYLNTLESSLILQ